MTDFSRRRLLIAGAGTVAAGLTTGGRARASAASASRPPETVTVTGTAIGIGTYNYHPFAMPEGVNRIDVALTKLNSPEMNNIGLGIFDPRGTQYATATSPNGFRGIFGQERSSFTITPATATNAFIPGPLTPGTWNLCVPIFGVGPQPMNYSIAVTMTFGDSPAAFVYGTESELVNNEPGWYRGDLHCHTQASSDALSSGSAMLPADWAKTCQKIGLDYVALTDHNVISQNFALAAAAAGTDVLVMAGEEMTNWFWGHATVSGISPGDWVDWRQLPAEQQTQESLLDPTTGTIQEFIAHARSLGAFIAAAHPLGATLAWRFFGDAAADPAARTDSLEVWTGPFQPDDQATVAVWDSQLVQGQRIVANGGSDLHGVVNTSNVSAGTPTTVVHAQALGKRAIISALKIGRSFITRTPMGAEAYLSVTNASGEQRQIMGGTIYGAATDTITITVDMRRAAGLRMNLVMNGSPLTPTVLSDPDQSVSMTIPFVAGYVRAELHGEVSVDPTNPTAGRLDMEALTNPVWLVLGPTPDGTVRDDTEPPPPDGNSGPVAALPEVGSATLLPAAGLALGTAALLARRKRQGQDVARPVTHTEFGMLATGVSWRERVEITGQVTAVGDGAARLTRWIPGCCSQEGALHIDVVAAPEDMVVGAWWSVVGRNDGRADMPHLEPVADEGHDHAAPHRKPSVLRAERGRPLTEIPPRCEV